MSTHTHARACVKKYSSNLAAKHSTSPPRQRTQSRHSLQRVTTHVPVCVCVCVFYARGRRAHARHWRGAMTTLASAADLRRACSAACWFCCYLKGKRQIEPAAGGKKASLPRGSDERSWVRTEKSELHDWMLIQLHYGIRVLAFHPYLAKFSW